ncbi:MAG: hypothetical protein LBB23_04895 [Rickettsiales bacterium]|nr:hypothetical protein [Rickettsiales bacterium]
MKTTYDIIKKQNGLEFANALRVRDSGLFDIPNLPDILKYAGRNAAPLFRYLNSLKRITIDDYGEIPKDPFELLKQAGYDAYLAETAAQHNAITKYYMPKEKVCFLDDGFRQNSYYIINCVKFGAAKLNRDDFHMPMRNDEYGTSVISIHILKSGGFICITNRYNHAVENPDNTFNSNPDNIIHGLSAALRSYLNVDFASPKVSVPEGFILVSDRIVKYNYEINGIYYGDGFHCFNGKISDIDPGRYILMDYFIYDQKEKIVRTIDSSIEDGLVDALQDEIQTGKPSIALSPDLNTSLKVGGRQVVETKDGKIISVDLQNMEKPGKNFMHRSDALEKANIQLRNVNPLEVDENCNGFILAKIYCDYAANLRREHSGRGR